MSDESESASAIRRVSRDVFEQLEHGTLTGELRRRLGRCSCAACAVLLLLLNASGQVPSANVLRDRTSCQTSLVCQSRQHRGAGVGREVQRSLAARHLVSRREERPRRTWSMTGDMTGMKSAYIAAKKEKKQTVSPQETRQAEAAKKSYLRSPTDVEQARTSRPSLRLSLSVP